MCQMLRHNPQQSHRCEELSATFPARARREIKHDFNNKQNNSWLGEGKETAAS